MCKPVPLISSFGDIRLTDMSGEEVFRVANSRSLAPPFIFMTAFGQIDQAVSLVRAGACDYLTKPFDLESLLQKAREIISHRPRDIAEGILGVSPQMQQIEALLRRYLNALATGTFDWRKLARGRRSCARYLHQVSWQRASRSWPSTAPPFHRSSLKARCIGHEKGAVFRRTPASSGLCGASARGTLFLDEIAEYAVGAATKC